MSAQTPAVALSRHQSPAMNPGFEDGEAVWGGVREEGGGVEMWSAVVCGKSGRCRHRVAVKKLVVIREDTDLVWVQNQVEELRRSSAVINPGIKGKTWGC
ncbi:hypothetical protein SSX86_032292, partial [Deinandra increscens subsp. villosa]